VHQGLSPSGKDWLRALVTEKKYGARRGRRRLVGDGKGDGSSLVASGREIKREEAVRFAEDLGSYVREGCCNRWSVWVWGGD